MVTYYKSSSSKAKKILSYFAGHQGKILGQATTQFC